MPISLDDYQSFESLSSRQPRPPTTPEDDSWEITKGFSAGVDETFALLGGALPAALGSLVGADEFQADRMDYYREQMRLAAESRGSNTTLEEIDGFDDALNFGLYHIGNMIPSLIGGGAAGAAVKGAAKNTLQRKFEQEAKEKLAKVARDLPRGLSQKEAKRLQADYTAAAISKPLQKRAALGFGAYSVGSGIGESFARILEEEGVEAPMLAIGTGVMSGALDALAPIAAIKKVFPEGISDKVVQQVGKSLTSPNIVSKGSKVLFEAAKFGVGEGTTEAVQEILQNASQAAVYAEGGEDALNLWYERMTDSVSTSAYLNAAAAGAVGGSALGGASSVLTGYGAKTAQSRELLDTVDGETDTDKLENLQNLPPLDMEVDDTGPVDSEVIEAEEAVGTPLPVEEIDYESLPLVEVSSEKSSKPTKVEGLNEDREQAIFDGDMDFQEQLSKLTAARLKVKPIVEEQLPVAEFEEISFPALGQLVGKEVQYGKHHGFLRREGNEFIVITQDGPDPIVPGSEDDNSYDLGLVERIDPVEFDDRVEINDPVNPTEFTLRDKNYKIEKIDRGEDGKIKAVQAVAENGNLRTIRDKSVLNRFDRLMSESQMERQEPTSIPLDDLPSAVRFQAMRQSTNLGEMPESLTLDQAREIVQSLPVAQQATATRELDAALGRFNVAVAPDAEALIPRSSFDPTMDVDFNEVATDPDSIALDLMSEDTFIDKEGNEFPQAANAFVDGDPGLNTLSLAITDIMAKGRMSPELALTGQGVHIFDDGVSNRLDGINGVFDTDTNQIAVSRSLIEAATSDPDAATTLRIGIAHEIGHRTDLMRSITDGDEGFSFTINEITPSSKDVEFGPILGELYQAFAAENELGRMMAYPFAALNGRLDALTPQDLKDGAADRVLNTQRKEAFAQAFSVFFTNPSLLQRHAPKTYAFLDNLNNNPLEGIVDEAQNRFEVRRGERSTVPSEIRTPPDTGGVEIQDTGGDRPTRGVGVEEGQTGTDLGEQAQEFDGVSERRILRDEIEDTPPLPDVEEINDVDVDDVDITERPNLKADLNKFLEGREENQPPAVEPSPTPTRTENLDRYFEKLVERGMDPERARQKSIIQVERDEVRKSYIEEGMDPKEAVRLSKEEVPDVDEPDAPKSNVTKMGDDELYMPSLRMSELEDQKLARSAGDVSTVERISRGIQDLVNPKERTRRDVVSDMSQRVVQGIFDDMNRIGYLEKKMNDGELLDGNQSAYKAALWSKNIDTVMQAAFVGGPIEKKDGGFQMVTGEKGFYEIFLDYDKSELRQWELWAAANRADRLIKEGRERLFTQSEIDEIKAEAVATGQEEKFKNTLAEWIKFNRKILDLGEATGVIDPESRKRWDKDDYVPFYRFEDEQDVNDGDSDISIAASGIANQSLKIRKLVGGEGKINPLEAMQSLMTQIVAKSFKNEAMQRTVAVLDGTDALMEVADSKSIQELSRDKNSDIIKVSYDGKQKYFVVRDPVLLRSVKGLGVEALDRIGKLVSLPKTVLTRGVTISPAFMMRNAIRDVMAATIQFPNSPGFIDGFKQAIGYVSRGIKAELPGGEINTEDQTDLLQIMASGGLAIGDFYGTGKAKDIRKDLNRINALDTTLKDQAALDGFYDNYLDLGADKAKNLWNKWNRVGQAFEQASRVNIYRMALENGETHAEAISQAADVLNFSKSGGWSVIRRMVESYPFFNARLQGLNVMGRSIRDNREYVLRKGGELAALSIALYMINADNEEYEQLPDYDKDMYFHIFTNDEHFRIPKPFELGFLFGTLPERMATFWREDKDMNYFLDTFHDGLYQALSFDVLPQVIQPVVDAYGNQDRFREMPIVSRALENAPAREQYTIFTNDTAKWIAQNMPDAAPEMLKSPAKMDFLLRGYFASFNWMASQVLDEMVYDNEFGERPAKTTAQWPLVGSFYRTEAQNTKYGTLFYEVRNEMNEIRRQYKSLIDTGKTEAARELLEENDGFEAVRAGIATYYKRIKALNAKRDLIYKDRELSAEAKRDQIQKIYIERNRLYKEAFDKYGAAM